MPRLPDAAEIAYMEAHINDTRVPDIIACTSICGIASIVFIALRLISRRISKAGIATSDWLILFAWVSLSSCRSGDLQQFPCDGQLGAGLGNRQLSQRPAQRSPKLIVLHSSTLPFLMFALQCQSSMGVVDISSSLQILIMHECFKL